MLAGLGCFVWAEGLGGDGVGGIGFCDGGVGCGVDALVLSEGGGLGLGVAEGVLGVGEAVPGDFIGRADAGGMVEGGDGELGLCGVEVDAAEGDEGFLEVWEAGGDLLKEFAGVVEVA